MSENKRRLLILSEIISPYRIPVFNALAKREDIHLHVVFLAETDTALRQWPVYANEIQFSYQVLPSFRVSVAGGKFLFNRGLGSCLREFAPQTVLCGGYNYFASWQALWWAQKHHVDFVLWSESNRHDARTGRAWVEFLKTYFLARCARFVVPGKAATEYLESLGVSGSAIIFAPNAVGNEFFAARAQVARAAGAEFRSRFGLPARYLLFVGRLVEPKGVFDLLEAYGQLPDDVRSQVGLVFAGDGECRRQLEQKSESVRPGSVCFPGFVHREELAGLYSLAECLVLPTHTDTWGLVVNEAMACGLPVIVTEVAGCSADLVENDWNGRVVPARNPTLLRDAIDFILQSSERRQLMSQRSLQRIQAYSPEACAAGLAASAFPAGSQVQSIP